MRALVTGGCGFVGATLCRRLADAGIEVVALDNLSLGSRAAIDDRIRLVVADVRDPAIERVVVSERPEVVFHLAAIHHTPTCERDPASTISVNVEGTQRLLEACVAGAAEAVVVASTGAVYAPSPHPHRENSELGPTDVYGHTKLWAEQLTQLFHERTGLPIAVVRLFNVYGSGETNPHLIPTIFRQAAQSSDLRLGDLSTKRAYVFVDDVADGLLPLGVPARQSSWLVTNIGGSKDYDGSQIVDSIARVLGRRLTIRTDPTLLRRSDRPRLAADCSWATKHLGWRPKTTLEEGLRAAAERPLAVGVNFE